MRSIRHLNPMVRATGVIGAVAILVTGVTFAALNNQASMLDSSVTAESAALRVDNDEDGTFTITEDGLHFTNLVPGTPSDPETFAVQNVSSGAVDVHVRIAAEPDALPDGVSPTELTFTFTPSPSGSTVNATWAELTSENGKLLLADLSADGTQEYNVTVTLANTVGDAVNITDFDIVLGTPETE
jgi:hypothetical protein